MKIDDYLDIDEDRTLSVLDLHGSLTIREVDDLRARLIEALDAARELSIRCSDAIAVDLSAVQILIAARRSAEARGIRLTIAGPPGPAMADALQRGGFLLADGRPTGADAAWFIGMDTP